MERKEVPRLFFVKEEQDRIVKAIEEAEKKTSAEIVVRLEKECHVDPLERCRQLLTDLHLTSTKGRNAVIILITVQDHKAAIYGDEAIDQVLGQKGWHEIIDRMVEGFKQGQPCDALVIAIGDLAEHLSVCFPCSPEDINELSNAPTYSDEH